MGMFDSLYSQDGTEWQTKALGRALDAWRTGERIPGPPITYQMEVIGGADVNYAWAFADIDGGVFVGVSYERNTEVPLLQYANGWVERSVQGGETR